MKQLLCRVLGHQRTLVAFTSNRFSCRRCGADLGRDIPVMPTPPAAARTTSRWPESPSGSGDPVPQDWPLSPDETEAQSRNRSGRPRLPSLYTGS